MTLETVKTVNGIAIQRYAGYKFPYFVGRTDENPWADNNEFFSFKTCKEAVKFIEDGGI
jgi:hypothetical protein